jgi:hypothetical protein
MSILRFIALRGLAVVLLAMVLPIQSMTAQAQGGGSAARSQNVDIRYIAPRNGSDLELFNALQRNQVLEKLQAFFSPLQLPRKLLLKLQGCEGEAGAYYEDNSVTVCVEAVNEMVQAAEKQKRKRLKVPVEQKTIVIGGFFHVVLHEVSHAIFDQLKLPILGREEDAADQLAAYVVLNLEPTDSRKLVTAAVYLFADEAGVLSSRRKMKSMTVKSRLEDFSGFHSTPAQRLYNMLCMAYGSNSKVYAFAVESGALPKDRAEGCADEYVQVQQAYRKLVVPHIDLKLGRMIKQQRWLSLEKP